ncbi:MAG: D-alanine--poly(phosphoribitol) ligase subunit DltA [Peptococcaceae bacterium]|nr:D-alanine--poly(phosphoribitol) ligase subunit DltA [Peptococcaceae bacterium]
MNLVEIIDHYASVCPDRIVHSYRGSSLTYLQLKERSDALASYLIDTYGEDKTPIVVFGHKQHEMLICFLACVKSGHAYIPIDESLPVQRIRDIIESSRTKLVLEVSGLGSETAEGEFHVLSGNEMNSRIEGYLGKKPSVESQVQKEETYYIIYTSGSTGKPKGVQITLSNLESFVGWGLGLCSLAGTGEVFLNQAPFSFDLSVMDLYLALASGSTLYSIDKTMIANPKELFAFFRQSGVSVWVSTPSFAEMCLADSGFNEELLPALKVLLFCGETLSNNCARKLYQRFSDVKVINSYGPTEATVAVTALHVDREMCEIIEPLPVGYVKNDCRILIVDPEGVPVAEGDRGEIVIAGESVSPGYYRNQEMTAKAFSIRTIDWTGHSKTVRTYRTGDEGYLKEGLLYYSGRIDFQIKLNGFRIELEDIENNLRKLEFIENAVVLPIRKEDKVQYLTAVAVLNRKLEQKEFETVLFIKNELKKYLPEYMIPRKIVLRESIPMTVNGKINRAKLLEEIK